ncbi:MAG: sigma-70 family RNA polymerase sigma factor, partial [Candidatus Azambacteria bacterium]|nr:sigma-70 family RNA polymerase sigma factor [Candidatus Azambacteria bacterium]
KTRRETVLTAAYYDFEKGLNLYAFFKTQNNTVSKELVQETFMKTWIYLAKGGEIDKMKAFLYHVLNDLIIDEYRKQKIISLDKLSEKGFEVSTNNSERLLRIIDGKMAILLIQNLPEKYRNVIHMRFVQILSLKEISIITEQSRNTVTVQIHRGIEKLRALYNLK